MKWINKCICDIDMLVWLGGDEFVVIVFVVCVDEIDEIVKWIII